MKKIKYLMPILGVAAIAGTTLPLAVSCDMFETNTIKIKYDSQYLRFENDVINLDEEKFSTRLEYMGGDLIFTGVKIYKNGIDFKKFNISIYDPKQEGFDAKVEITDLSSFKSGDKISFEPQTKHVNITEPTEKVFHGEDNAETASTVEDYKNYATLYGFSMPKIEIEGHPSVAAWSEDEGEPLGKITGEFVEDSVTDDTINFGIKLTFGNRVIPTGIYNLQLEINDATGTTVLTSRQYTVEYTPKLLAYTPNGKIWGQDEGYTTTPLKFEDVGVMGFEYFAESELTFIYLHETQNLYVRFWGRDDTTYKAEDSASMPPVVSAHNVTNITYEFRYQEGYEWINTFVAYFDTFLPLSSDSANDKMGIYWKWDGTDETMNNYELLSPRAGLFHISF